MTHKYDGRVFNLRTGTWLNSTWSISLGGRGAVIAAYAQSKGDYNTADYETKFGSQVTEGNVCFALGDFSAFKD